MRRPWAHPAPRGASERSGSRRRSGNHDPTESWRRAGDAGQRPPAPCHDSAPLARGDTCGDGGWPSAAARRGDPPRLRRQCSRTRSASTSSDPASITADCRERPEPRPSRSRGVGTQHRRDDGGRKHHVEAGSEPPPAPAPFPGWRPVRRTTAPARRRRSRGTSGPARASAVAAARKSPHRPAHRGRRPAGPARSTSRHRYPAGR
jgi:hypothetical protein